MTNGEKIKKFIEHIKVYTGYYFTIVSALGIIWGAFALFDNWKHENTKIQTDVKTIITSQKTETKTDSLLLVNQMAMQKKLEEIEAQTKQNTEKIESLQMSYIKYISNDKTLTKEDFLKYMNGLSYDVKKNSSSYGTQITPSTASVK